MNRCGLRGHEREKSVCNTGGGREGLIKRVTVEVSLTNCTGGCSVSRWCLAYARTHTTKENEYEEMMLNRRRRETKAATSVTGGELTQSTLTRERPGTVSKSSRSLRGDYGPPVRHDYWNTASLLGIETLRGASTDWRAGGRRKQEAWLPCTELPHQQRQHKQRSGGGYLYMTLMMSTFPTLGPETVAVITVWWVCDGSVSLAGLDSVMLTTAQLRPVGHHVDVVNQIQILFSICNTSHSCGDVMERCDEMYLTH